MSGAGAPRLRVADADRLRVAVVAAQWHQEVMSGLLGGADRALAEAGVRAVTRVEVPGTFELAVAARRVADDHDAIVALGVVVRGGTPHFDYICQAAAAGLTQVCVLTGVPVGFGVLTCDTEEQARRRSGLAGATEDKGYEAAQAATATAAALRGHPRPPARRGAWEETL